MTIIRIGAAAAALALAAGCGGGDVETSWTEVGVRDVSYPGVKRVNAVVLVPMGLGRQELTALLESAAASIAEREEARAVLLDAFRWEDEVAEGTYSVGRVYYAPNGNWMDAAKDDPMAATVELGTLYFREDQRYYRAGDRVVLDGGGEVALFETTDTSREDRIAAAVPAGTPAEVVGRSIRVFGGRTEHVRYQVRVDGDGATGWVPPESIRPPE